MVTGVSRSLLYKLRLLAELNRCWKSSLWLIRNKVSRRIPPTLCLDVETGNGEGRGLKQSGADELWLHWARTPSATPLSLTLTLTPALPDGQWKLF